MANFWTKLKKPILALAPMAGLTDSAFRQIAKDFGADVVYSELASATALVYNPQKTLEMLAADEKERPYVVQLFGANPEHFATAARFLTGGKGTRGGRGKGGERGERGERGRLVPDGIDINFGCPVKKVAKQGAGAILMTDLKLSHAVIKAVIDNTGLPVSLKIRAGAGKVTALEFLKKMRDLPIAAVMIHGRTMGQGHTGNVDWQIIKEARQHFGGIILANGGVVDRQSALELLEKTGADGLGIARGVLGKPWLFSELKISNFPASRRRATVSRGGQFLISKEEIFKIALKHARLAYKLKGRQGIVEMRKHLCAYVTGLPNAGELRRELVQAESLKEIKRILR